MSDQFYDLTTALLSFEPDALSSGAVVVDRSVHRGSWFVVGSVSPISTVWKKFGDYSLGHFTPSDTVYCEDASVLAIGGQDFCIESWVNLDAVQPSHTPALLISVFAPDYDWYPDAFGIFCDRDDDASSGKLSFHAANASPQRLLESTSVVAGAGPTHIAITRSGNTWRLFINGQIQSTATWGGTLNNPSAIYAACLGSDTRVATPRWYVKGYFDEFRITIGVPRYTSNFVPATAPFFFAQLTARSVSTLPFRQVPPGSIPATPSLRSFDTYTGRLDVYFSGKGRITGTVKQKATPSNVPLRRRVFLLDETTNLIVRDTWSDAATGAYSFDAIDMNRRYTVITYDYENNYRAVIADNIVAEQTP